MGNHKQCPFHEDSTATEQEGDLRVIHCPHCGDYRISKMALARFAQFPRPPRGWSEILAKGRLISSRDASQLLV